LKAQLKAAKKVAALKKKLANADEEDRKKIKKQLAKAKKALSRASAKVFRVADRI
jgi:guanylate kinase